VKWKEIPKDIRQKILDEKDSGIPIEDLAARYDMRVTTIDRRLREFAASLRVRSKALKPLYKLIDWNENSPYIKGNNVVVIGDLELPYADYDLVNKMFMVAETLARPRYLVIAGDMFHMDAFSMWPKSHNGQASFDQELKAAQAIIKRAAEVFDEIHILTGNHERRLLYRTLGELYPEHLALMLGADSLYFYIHSWCTLETKNGPWRITHQKEYAKASQTIGVTLAHKYQINVITHHRHRASVGFDTSGNFIVIDNGCMADENKCQYRGLLDTTYPIWNKGFVVFQDGVAVLCSTNKALTNWNKLLEYPVIE